jgi:hypothetical protein
VDYDGPDALTCPRCGTRVKPDSRTRTGVGRHDLGDGVTCTPDDYRNTPLDALPVVSEAQARARRLVSVAIIARRFGTKPGTVHTWTARSLGFPAPAATLDTHGSSGVVVLYPADAVEDWATRGPGQSMHTIRAALAREQSRRQ